MSSAVARVVNEHPFSVGGGEGKDGTPGSHMEEVIPSEAPRLRHRVKCDISHFLP